MKLLVKFNLVLFILFALAIGGTALVSRDLLQRNARAEIYENAKLLIESALAVRSYTSANIAPLLETQIKYEFRPEMVSAYLGDRAAEEPARGQPRVQELPVSRGRR